MFEIVPVDPVSKLQKRSDSLEQDIREIKNALRGTVGLSKLESNADNFIQKMLDLMTASQKMVEEVAASNQKVADKIQNAIDHMNHANEELSQKLSHVLEFFAQATEAMANEGEEAGAGAGGAGLVSAIGELKESVEKLGENTARSVQLLQSIEKGFKRQAVPHGPLMQPRSRMGMPPPPPGMVGRSAPPAGGEPDLPPPPFPP